MPDWPNYTAEDPKVHQIEQSLDNIRVVVVLQLVKRSMIDRPRNRQILLALLCKHFYFLYVYRSGSNFLKLPSVLHRLAGVARAYQKSDMASSLEVVRKRAKPRIYIFYYNRDAIMEKIPLLIEARTDILNLFQVICKGMDIKNSQKKFGEDLTLWGRSCNMQAILPFGTSQEIRDETRRIIKNLVPDSSFIFALTRTGQGEVLPENIMAWWKMLNKYSCY